MKLRHTESGVEAEVNDDKARQLKKRGWEPVVDTKAEEKPAAKPKK